MSTNVLRSSLVAVTLQGDSTLTTDQAALLIGISTNAIRKSLIRGKLPAVQSRGRWLIKTSDALNYQKYSKLKPTTVKITPAHERTSKTRKVASLAPNSVIIEALQVRLVLQDELIAALKAENRKLRQWPGSMRGIGPVTPGEGSELLSIGLVSDNVHYDAAPTE